MRAISHRASRPEMQPYASDCTSQTYHASGPSTERGQPSRTLPMKGLFPVRSDRASMLNISASCTTSLAPLHLSTPLPLSHAEPHHPHQRTSRHSSAYTSEIPKRGIHFSTCRSAKSILISAKPLRLHINEIRGTMMK